MARPTLDQLRHAGDFATTVHWDVSFPTLPNGLRGLVSSEYLNLRCESTDVPKATNMPIEIAVRGHFIKQPGLTRPSGQINLMFYDTVDSRVSEFIRLWREICYETNTGIQTARVDAQAVVLLNRRDRQDRIIWNYELHGVFLEDYDPGGQLQSQSAEAIRPSMILSYDKFIDKKIG